MTKVTDNPRNVVIMHATERTGGRKLEFNGHLYNKYSTRVNGSSIFQCVIDKCRATFVFDETRDIRILQGVHSGDHGGLQALLVRVRLNTLVETYCVQYMQSTPHVKRSVVWHQNQFAQMHDCTPAEMKRLNARFRTILDRLGANPKKSSGDVVLKTPHTQSELNVAIPSNEDDGGHDLLEPLDLSTDTNCGHTPIAYGQSQRSSTLNRTSPIPSTSHSASVTPLPTTVLPPCTEHSLVNLPTVQESEKSANPIRTIEDTVTVDVVDKLDAPPPSIAQQTSASSRHASRKRSRHVHFASESRQKIDDTLPTVYDDALESLFFP